MSALQSFNHGSLVDDLATSSVDQHSALAHLANHLRAHKALRLLAQRDMHADDVRLREHLVEAVLAVVLAPLGRVLVRAAVVVHDAHGERVHEVREAQTDAAQSEDSDRAPGEVERVAGAQIVLPAACAHVALGLRELAQRGDDEV